MTQTIHNYIKLPEWHEVSEKEDKGEPLTALEKFILGNEPAGNKDEALFRDGLLALVIEVFNDGFNACEVGAS